MPTPEPPVIFEGEIPPPSLPTIKMSTILAAAICGFTAVIVIICFTQPPQHLVRLANQELDRARSEQLFH